jgi:hypothetical protein
MINDHNDTNHYLLEFLSTKNFNFNDYFLNEINDNKVRFQKTGIPFDWTYASMHIVAQKILLSLITTKQKYCSLLDVGSQFSFISFASSFCEVTYVEPRVQSQKIFQNGICDITKCEGEAQKLPFEKNKFDIITSLHAIEHFGLGRYGDTIDYHGDQKGIIEFTRVMSKNGHAILAVPAAKKSNIEFNDQRKYNPNDFDQIVVDAGLKKISSALTYPPFTFSDGSLVSQNVDEILEIFPEHYTPPVYIALYEKVD